ncbi:MAG TPA: contractile injection system tape measure protein, partial [Azospirillaceae bacterium]|nr:contractile injection system tape measure protein [Azospirillaceae bacterium]
MPSQTHHVRALTLKAEVDGTGLAFAIRSRLEELMRGRVPALLAAAFDARVPPDVHIRMDRLELKLGVLPAQGLEEALLAALERAVDEALDALLVQPDGGLPGGPEVRRVPAGAVPPEVLEHFLTRGTLPFWAGRAVALPALLAEVADAQPAGLRALLLRLGRDRRAL